MAIHTELYKGPSGSFRNENVIKIDRLVTPEGEKREFGCDETADGEAVIHGNTVYANGGACRGVGEVTSERTHS